MGYQYLFNGVKRGEHGLLVALEEHPVQIRISMSQFGWDVSKYEEDGEFTIVDSFTAGIGEAAKREKYVVRAPDDFQSLIDILRTAIKEVRGELKRSLIIWKMRGTSHSMKRHPFEITENGIIVYPKEVVEIPM